MCYQTNEEQRRMVGGAEEEICITHKSFALKILYYLFLFKLSKFSWEYDMLKIFQR